MVESQDYPDESIYENSSSEDNTNDIFYDAYDLNADISDCDEIDNSDSNSVTSESDDQSYDESLDDSDHELNDNDDSFDFDTVEDLLYPGAPISLANKNWLKNFDVDSDGILTQSTEKKTGSPTKKKLKYDIIKTTPIKKSIVDPAYLSDQSFTDASDTDSLCKNRNFGSTTSLSDTENNTDFDGQLHEETSDIDTDFSGHEKNERSHIKIPEKVTAEKYVCGLAQVKEPTETDTDIIVDANCHQERFKISEKMIHDKKTDGSMIVQFLENLPKEYVIADFGCGDAKLCEPVEQKVHSLDLVAVNDKVTACDMAHTSLLTISVNVVVFCLSFIGKNLADYLLEANRVLKQDGILKIADVVSRFENIKGFVKSLDKYGFQNTYQDLSNNLFYFMDFKEIEDVNRRNKNLPQIYLKTCLYKRR
ncbi:hypothetical protein HCN44_000322 [Aphidius gifuensis]|uniref:Ribosomal RNA-processing protein 8 n=1 Tax=Aphidius gifuensis TaxID=684658 RepID=A0A834XRU8_APHGI|nr:hypothetical protein HCN44_000322 [Aphidius gifuensis]